MFKTIGRIMKWAGNYRVRLYAGFICSFLSAWCVAGPVMVAAWVLDKIIQDSRGNAPIDGSLVWMSLGVIILLILLRFLFTYLKNRLQESIGHEIGAEQRVQIGDMLKRVSLGYFAKNNIGDILAALTTELSTLELHSMKMIDSVVNGYIQVIAIICYFAFISPLAALIALAGVLLSALALRGISKQSAYTAPISHAAKEALSGATIEYVRGLSVVKSFGQEGVSIQRFHQASHENKDICIRNEFGFVPWNCLHLFFLKAAAVALLLVSAWQTLQGGLPLAYLLAIAMFSFTIFSGVESINDAAHILSVIDAVLDRLDELKQEKYIDHEGKAVSINHYDINFDHVSFSYGEREILHDISFTVPQNTTTAIVGPSGSGKSTICSLIAHFYDANAGKITIGGRDVQEFHCDSLLSNISMVFQNVYLFNDTIKNNIRFGKPGATDEEIISAAKAARCHDFINALPDGYDTMIGEGGNSLSGGEKQRISIARAMLKDSPIIILDEATASIDPENEYEIQQAISALVHGKTIITIAHRLATIEQANQILVVDDGRIVQTGTHEELQSQEGVYKNFIQLRKKAEGWRIE